MRQAIYSQHFHVNCNVAITVQASLIGRGFSMVCMFSRRVHTIMFCTCILPSIKALASAKSNLLTLQRLTQSFLIHIQDVSVNKPLAVNLFPDAQVSMILSKKSYIIRGIIENSQIVGFHTTNWRSSYCRHPSINTSLLYVLSNRALYAQHPFNCELMSDTCCTACMGICVHTFLSYPVFLPCDEQNILQ